MKHLAFFACLLLTACTTPKPISLKGKYFEIPPQVQTEKSFDEILESVKSTLQSQGIAIKEYSKATGEIITERVKVPFTTEDKTGKLKNPNAHIVYALEYSVGAQKVIPIFGYIVAEWSITLLQTIDGSFVTVRPIHVANEYTQGLKTISKPMPVYRSTGVFEKNLLSTIAPK